MQITTYFCSVSLQGITLTIVPSPSIINADEVVVQVKAVGIDSIDNRIACGYGRLLRRHLGLSAVRLMKYLCLIETI